MPHLVTESGKNIGSDVSFEGSTILGRTAQVQVKDVKASRRHSRIERRGDRYVLLDLASRNGTFLNGCRIEEAPLRNGDRITIGDTTFVFLDSEDRSVLSDSGIEAKAPPPPKTAPPTAREERAVRRESAFPERREEMEQEEALTPPEPSTAAAAPAQQKLLLLRSVEIFLFFVLLALLFVASSMATQVILRFLDRRVS